MEEPEINRPDPDKLLEKLRLQEKENPKGKLKIFFGMCAGVGKTYAMLQAARKAKADGIDVVLGIVETHKRIETEELVEGFEKIPLKEITYRESFFKEFDLDVALKRKPSLIIVDELAHTNIPGSRNVKRYLDVIELLNNGIDVYTTLNVQHIESRSETVRQITGTTIRETVPDSILDEADDIELVDITPDKLLQRLAEGKVYTEERSKLAIKNFFRKGNLTALREMALRVTAERVNKDLLDYKAEKNIYETWKSGQRLLCAIGPSPYSANLIRWTRQLADSMEATWLAVYVETDQKISEDNKNILAQNFKLVKELDGELITTQDINIIDGLIRVAKENNATQIIIGKSRKSRFQKFFSRTDFTKSLLGKSGDIDVYIVGGEREEEKSILYDFKSVSHSTFPKYFFATLIVALFVLISFYIQPIVGYEFISLLFLLVISVLPLFNFGIGPVLHAALLSALSWNYFFILPQYTFHIERPEDVLMFIMYFIVASVTGYFSTKVRAQQRFLKQREEKTSALYLLSKELSSASGIDDVAEISVRKIEETFKAEAVLLFAESEKKLKAKPHPTGNFLMNDFEWAFAQWCFSSNQKTGRFTNTLPNAEATYYPLKSKNIMLGVIGIRLLEDPLLSFDQEDLLNSFLEQIISALEREYLNEVAKKSLLSAESEKLYKTLFNSISHELKTPLTTIISAASSFNEKEVTQNPKAQSKIINEIKIAAERLHRLVANLLDMARLESGNLKLKRDWHSINDLLNSCIDRLKEESTNHKISIKADDDFVFQFDYALLEQAFVNILHNSLMYTPIGSEIKIEADSQNKNCIITISDNGKGFSEEELPHLFEKFFRLSGSQTGGTGLGLSIAKGLVEAHGGTISAMNSVEGGAVFTIIIPISTENYLTTN
ncbi:MAG: sensor histidine kinase KdpD [Ignavibacteriaceae bacterium]|nr:sensor histidine kinase KdpD [Ignavibacteriaceae bacterium]